MKTLSLRSAAALSVLILCFAVSVFADDPIVWKPVSDAELQQKTPVVDKDADAEAIFWEVRLDDKSRSKLYYEHYVRIKVFTERGRETYSKIDIKYFEDTKVENIAARVIKQDGTIINVNPSEIFVRDIIKSRRIKIKSSSFAVPGIEPGVIIEYQYRERFKGDDLDGERLIFQRDLPIQRAQYWVRPYKNTNLSPTYFNMPDVMLTRDPTDDEFMTVKMTNVPAFKEEPYMAPEDMVRPWAFLEYSGWGSGWSGYGRNLGNGFDYITDPDKATVRKAEEITQGASGELEQIKRIYDFVQKEIKNITYDKSGFSGDLKFKKSSDTLKRGMGTASQVDFLFASLLRGIKKSPALTLTSDRSEFFFNPNTSPSHGSFIHIAGISLLVDGKRMFFKPGTPYLPFGRLVWYEENVPAMVTNYVGYRWVTIEPATHEETYQKRIGKFKLDSDGNLTGTIEKEYDGYLAIEERRGDYGETDEKKIENIKKSVESTFSTAEVSDIFMSNFDAPNEPLIHNYKVKINGYAQKTGSRMFLTPGVFESQSKPVFSSSTRIHPVYFRYPWSEIDEIEIELPKGFALENFSIPTNITENGGLGGSDYSLTYDLATHKLNYKRKFFFGAKKMILFPATTYAPLKMLFDRIHDSDTHTLALKRTEPVP